MDIKPLLPKEHVILGIKEQDRRKLLETIAQPLVDDEIVDDLEQFINDVEERESAASTQNGEVAFPHAVSKAAKRLGLAVAIAHEPGIVFDPQSETPCRVFFLFAIPAAAAPNSYLNLLSHLVEFVLAKGKLLKLVQSKTPAAAARTLTSWKRPNP